SSYFCSRHLQDNSRANSMSKCVARFWAKRMIWSAKLSQTDGHMATDNEIVIRRAGPPTSRGPKALNTTIPFRIEVETLDGPGALTVAPQAAAVLAQELARYLKQHGQS